MVSKSGLFEILEKIKSRPGAYIGQPSVLDLFVFLAGYKTARRELGVNPTEEEIVFYDSFHGFVEDIYHVKNSNSWAKIIMLYCQDNRAGFDRFFELLAEFKQVSLNSPQPQEVVIKG